MAVVPISILIGGSIFSDFSSNPLLTLPTSFNHGNARLCRQMPHRENYMQKLVWHACCQIDLKLCSCFYFGQLMFIVSKCNVTGRIEAAILGL